MDIPEEIWRHILSYNLLHHTSTVHPDLYDIEKSLFLDREAYMDR